MKTNKYDEVLNIVRSDLKEYYFKIKCRRVKVVFSDNPNAPTIENALVKIVTRRIG